MTKHKTRVRISGLVRAAQRARERLAAGLSHAEAERLRAWVRGSVDRTEAICREHQMRPPDLPTPSYRAYRFLKELDLDDLPERKGVVPKATTTIYTSGIISSQDEMNACMAEWVSPEREVPTEDDPEVQALLERLSHHVGRVEARAREADATPGHLPTRSRRAYQWLKFLSDPARLMAHLETLRALQEACRARSYCKRVPRRIRKAPMEMAFTYASYLYKAQVEDRTLAAKVHEGFIGAPPDVLQALARVLFSSAEDADRDRVKAHAAGEDFAEVVTALEMTTTEIGQRTEGRCFDLEAIFERVNRTYFDGQLERPRLTWNERITQVKMGHYDFLRDTVMLSVTLDAPRVPDYVVDFVMYHELLHKKLGTKVLNGRHYAHTPAFREAERAFAHWEAAKAFLRNASRLG